MRGTRWGSEETSIEWSILNFSCSLTRNTTSHSIKNLAYHKLVYQLCVHEGNGHRERDNSWRFQRYSPSSERPLAFHSLLSWKMIILPNFHYLTYTFPLKRMGGCTWINLGVKGLTTNWTKKHHTRLGTFSVLQIDADGEIWCHAHQRIRHVQPCWPFTS